jgi:hypothetical protein
MSTVNKDILITKNRVIEEQILVLDEYRADLHRKDKKIKDLLKKNFELKQIIAGLTNTKCSLCGLNKIDSGLCSRSPQCPNK